MLPSEPSGESFAREREPHDTWAEQGLLDGGGGSFKGFEILLKLLAMTALAVAFAFEGNSLPSSSSRL